MVSIDAARTVPLSRLLSALGISGIGKKTAKILAEHISNIDALTHFSLSCEQLESIHDIGPETASNIVDFFTTRTNDLATLIPELDIQFSAAKPITRTALLEKSFCITGSFDGYSRDELTVL